MLQGVYDPMSEDKRTQVVKWAKEQFTENYFNCSLRPSSKKSSQKQLPTVKPSCIMMLIIKRKERKDDREKMRSIS